ncbi:MAG: LLM class flavin-dependent oxidoreductase [Anaerolineae bacterium]
MKLTVAFQTDKPLSAYGPLAATAEALGFDGVSIYNDMLYQPAWLPLYEIARHTRRVRIGPAAVNPFTCHPVQIAGQIALIDEASEGRAYLGMARGSWLDFVGIEPRRPVRALSEAIRCVQHLLSGSTQPLPGEIFPLAGGDTLRWPIRRPDIPIMLGSWGAQTIQACAGMIAEVKIGGTANPDVVPHMRRLLDDAAAAHGRPHEKIELVVGSVTVVDEDRSAARALARREVALYLPVVAALDPTVQIEPDRMARIRQAAERYDFDAAAALISDDILTRFALAGTPDDVAGQAIALAQAGADRVEFGTPHGLDETHGLRLLGERVLPLVREAVGS